LTFCFSFNIFAIFPLIAVHMAELSSALPKNCVLYQFSFATLGELPAFFAGWTAVLDAVCITTILCRTWSEHVNLLFRRHLHRFMSLPLMHRESGMWIVSEEYDLSALLAAMMSVFILCCNLRVVGTISLCLIVVAVLMTASCTMVGFFHADPQNWISANFFRFGFDGVLRSICALSCAFAGVDAASYLFDETKSPRRKMTVLLPTLVTLLSLFFFVVVMIFSLSTDVSKLSPETLVPEMFSVLNVPAAKYMLTVAAVCGLSGAVLSSFLPGSRIINALSTDRLLPLPADITRRPVMSVFIFFILVSFGLLINRTVLLHVILLTTPLKMVATVSFYVLNKMLGLSNLAGNGESIVTSTLSQDEEDESEDEDDEEDLDSDTSFDTAVFLQMALAKKETQRLQRKLEKKYLSETIPVLVKSVSHYNSMVLINKEPAKEMKYPGNHNCIADSCSARVSDGKYAGTPAGRRTMKAAILFT
uniref:AA_permease_C domain-containing protein n=1 Tax=Haemonchus placei TaxID=6290 RepID=A0A0N4WC72_HAEPC